MIQIAAFWKKESVNGRTYYTGKMGNGKLLVLENERKQQQKHPDMILYIVEEKSQDKGKRGE